MTEFGQEALNGRLLQIVLTLVYYYLGFSLDAGEASFCEKATWSELAPWSFSGIAIHGDNR